MPTILMPQDSTRSLSAPATEPAAALSPLPPAREQVSLRIVEHRGKLTEGKNRLSRENAALFLAVAVCVYAVSSFRSSAMLVWSCLVAILIGARLIVRISKGRQPLPELAMPLPPPRRPSRLTASGRADELHPIAVLTDVPFEPAIFTKVVSDGPFASLCAVILFISTCFWDMGARLFGAWFPFFLIVFTIYGLPYLLQRFAPTYYRIVPGRLDVLRGAFLGSRLYVQQSCDLRVAGIEVRFNDRFARLALPNSKPITLTLSCIDEPYRFVESLFRAAVCTHPAPPVPDDALLG